jgi:large subunit ribosomal protein L32
MGHPVQTEMSPSVPISIWDSILLWAVPKRRTSHSKKRMRMAHKYLKPKHHYQTCPKCGHLKLQHTLCGHCFRETMRLTAELRRRQAGPGQDIAGGEETERLSEHSHA